MKNYKIHKFPVTRLATIDIGVPGKLKHHIPALLELDVTESRKQIRRYNRENADKISFLAWLISTTSQILTRHEKVASFLKGKNNILIFDAINVSLLIEKELNGQKVPVPLVIEKANEKSVISITKLITGAREQLITESEIVLQKKSARFERLYYRFPGILRRWLWKYFQRNPRLAFRQMGNVAFTSVGMFGKVNGWFIPFSVHPVCFGVSSVVKKPVVHNDKILIREILNLTVLMDHDVIDGADMARFINDLSKYIEKGTTGELEM